MKPQSKEFKKLQSLWYDKLEKSGFEDIETRWEDSLITYAVSKVPKDQNTSYQAKEQYYRLAGQFLYEYEFKTELERKIWFLHSEGNSFRTIAKAVRTKKYKANKDGINVVIKVLATEMLKRYKEELENE